jgi:hypothetical protein
MLFCDVIFKEGISLKKKKISSKIKRNRLVRLDKAS